MVEKLDFEEKDEYVKEFQEKITRVGPINFVVMLVNDSYKGLDILETIELEVTEERDKMPGYKEYEYLKEDLVEIKQTSIFKRTPPEEIKFDDYSDDEGRPEVETDEAELLRRLTRDGMGSVAKDWEKHISELKANMKKLNFKQEPSPFKPKEKKSVQEQRELKKAEVAAKKNEEEIKQADQEIMGTGREPVPIESFKMLVGYGGLDDQLICFVPSTEWSQ